MQNISFENLHAWQKSAFCLAIAERNAVHVVMLCEMSELDPQPFTKLMNKSWAYLSGELKSEKNLQRFMEEFQVWQERFFTQIESFGEQAASLTRLALTSAGDSLFDESLDECQLVSQSVFELLEDFLQLQLDHQGPQAEEDTVQLKHLEQGFQQQCLTLINNMKQRGDKKIIELRKLAGQEKMSSIGIEY